VAPTTAPIGNIERNEAMPDLRRREAIALMTGFAERTGLRGGARPRRYLWTDAFATCNLLGLSHATGDAAYGALALRLVDAVHQVLGTHRPDDARRGRLAQADDAHPTRGGLRIGKPLPERPPGEPLDERLEWDRDGQYFHYLTKWMHALDQATRASGNPTFTIWARELAATAHRAFAYETHGGARRMHWKMSIDLTRPLVPSMGQHDPLDGLVTCWQLEATAAGRADGPGTPLASAARDFAAMLEPRALATADPLGLGALLTDAYRVEQLLRQGSMVADPRLLEILLAAAEPGLSHYARSADLCQPAAQRLAFRELGLAIGLAAVRAMDAGVRETPARFAGSPEARTRLERLVQFAALGAAIEAVWLEPASRRTAGWLAHEDINDVMLATSLAPDGFLVLRPPR
jgi:hypothetical protein